jgi:hypothetical protein
MEYHQYSRLAQDAAFEDYLDSACRIIQDAMGQTDGLLASIIFSDLDPEEWPFLPTTERQKRMEEYALAEFNHQSEISLSEFDVILTTYGKESSK